MTAGPTPPPAPAAALEGIIRLTLPSGTPWTPGPNEIEVDADVPTIDLYPVKSDRPTTAVIIYPGEVTAASAPPAAKAKLPPSSSTNSTSATAATDLLVQAAYLQN